MARHTPMIHGFLPVDMAVRVAATACSSTQVISVDSSQWPRGCANLVANIIGQERQFDSRPPSSSNRLSANFLQSKLMIHTNLDFGFHDFEHQPTLRSRIVLILTRNSTRPAV